MKNHCSNNEFCLIGSSLGAGAQLPETKFAPFYLKEMAIDKQLGIRWDEFLEAPTPLNPTIKDRLDIVTNFNKDLCAAVQKAILNKKKPIIIGGDHSMAIGTWSGVTTAQNATGNFGLIWIDAHLDSHTFETSPSKAIHGMPVASLLGYGPEQLINIGVPQPKLDPKHVVFIGIRSYEEKEHNLLKNLGVKIFYMDDVKSLGLETVIKQSLEIVSVCPGGFGISIDLDAFDPKEVPGVGSSEIDGIRIEEGLKALKGIAHHPNLKAIEIAELNPHLDCDDISSDFVINLLKVLLKQNSSSDCETSAA